MASGHLMQAQIPADAEQDEQIEEVFLLQRQVDMKAVVLLSNETTPTADVADTVSNTSDNLTSAETEDLASESEALTDNLIWEVWDELPKMPDGMVWYKDFRDNFAYVQSAFPNLRLEKPASLEFFTELDTNGDGKLSFEEWFEGMGNELLTNDDGLLKDETITVTTGVNNGSKYIGIAREVNSIQEFKQVSGSVKCEPFEGGTPSLAQDVDHCLNQCQLSGSCIGITYFLDDAVCYLFKECKQPSASDVRAVSFRKVGMVVFSPVPAPYSAPAPAQESLLSDIMEEDKETENATAGNATDNATEIVLGGKKLMETTNVTTPCPCATEPPPPPPYSDINTTQAPLVDPVASNETVAPMSTTASPE